MAETRGNRVSQTPTHFFDLHFVGFMGQKKQQQVQRGPTGQPLRRWGHRPMRSREIWISKFSLMPSPRRLGVWGALRLEGVEPARRQGTWPLEGALRQTRVALSVKVHSYAPKKRIGSSCSPCNPTKTGDWFLCKLPKPVSKAKMQVWFLSSEQSQDPRRPVELWGINLWKVLEALQQDGFLQQAMADPC